MTNVIYARYSSNNQQEESIEGQLREYKAFAEKNDIQNKSILRKSGVQVISATELISDSAEGILLCHNIAGNMKSQTAMKSTI